MCKGITVGNRENRYGYVIVLFSVLIQAIGLSIITSFSLFFVPMLSEFRWARATISLAATVNILSMAAASIVTGIATDRFGPKIVMTVQGIIFGLGLILMSYVSRPWQLYMSWGVISGTGASAINVVLLTTVARWFTSHRSLMTGVVKTGAGVGIFIMPFIITRLIQHTTLIQNSGWRSTAFILGIASVVIIAISAQFLRQSPVRKVEIRVNQGRQPGDEVPETADGSFTFGEAIKTRQFWMLCLAFFGFYYSFYTIQLHIAPHAEDLSISAANAAFIISIIGVASIVGRLGLGFIGDKLGTKLGLLICSLILIAGLSWLQIAGSLMMLYIFAVIHGIFHGGFQSLTSPATASLFGTKSIGIIFGATQFFAMSLGSLGGVLSGYFYDRFNNYIFAFLVCLALAVLSLIFLSLIRPIRKTA